MKTKTKFLYREILLFFPPKNKYLHFDKDFKKY